MQVGRPIDALLSRVRADVLADSIVDDVEVETLERLARDSTGGTVAVSAALRQIVEAPGATFASAATQARARALLDVAGGPAPRPDTDTVRYVAPPDSQTVRSHDLYIKKDGVLAGDTGRPAYSRGWGQFNAGVLLQAHGSSVPSSSVHDLAARARLASATPAARLDAALSAFGRTLPMNDFVGIARGFSRPDQPDWAGVCYAWSWAALDARLSTLVDVNGPEGGRGLWIGGQFLSRADLGNWLMALVAGLSQGAGDVMWYAPEGEDLLKAVVGSLMDGGRGFRADIGNSYKDRDGEIWFQPFVGGQASFQAVPGSVEDAILDIVAEPRRAAWGGMVPGVEGASVKLVRLSGRYGNEEADDHEGAPVISEMDWAMYAVLDDQGRLLKAVMADDPRLQKIPGLPATRTNPVPRELFAPDHALVDGILEGAPSAEVKGSVYGPALDFFVGTVLARGIPAATRKAFEAEPALQGAGPIAAADVSALQSRYPTIAAAFSPSEWQRFAARGLAADAFGAAEFSSAS